MSELSEPVNTRSFRGKSFLVLFSKEEPLACFGQTPMNEAMMALRKVQAPNGVALPDAEVIEALDVVDGQARLVLRARAEDRAGMETVARQAEARVARREGN